MSEIASAHPLFQEVQQREAAMALVALGILDLSGQMSNQHPTQRYFAREAGRSDLGSINQEGGEL